AAVHRARRGVADYCPGSRSLLLITCWQMRKVIGAWRSTSTRTASGVPARCVSREPSPPRGARETFSVLKQALSRDVEFVRVCKTPAAADDSRNARLASPRREAGVFPHREKSCCPIAGRPWDSQFLGAASWQHGGSVAREARQTRNHPGPR